MEEALFQCGPCPPAYVDETVYSWCARLFRLHCGLSARGFSRLLSGHPTACLRHDFPSRLERFYQHIQDGSAASELLLERTIYGIHAPFLSERADLAVRERLLGSQGSRAMRTLGIPRAGILALNALKFCPYCAETQREGRGTACWLTSQQLPSTFVCSVHRVWLMLQDTIQSRGVTDDFYLPDPHLARPYMLAPQHSPAFRALEKLGVWGLHFRAQREFRYTDAHLRVVYLLGAKARGWVALDGSLRMRRLHETFVNHFGEALGLLGTEFTGDISGTSEGFLPFLVRRFAGHRHPVKHLMLMSCLFDSFDEFAEAHASASSLLADGGEAAVLAKLRDGQDVLRRMVDEGQSASVVAQSMGIPVTQATRTLDKLGAEGRIRRPRIVGTARERELCKLLSDGQSRAHISSALCVRPAFIKDYLSTRQALKHQWADAYARRQREHYRRRLTEVLRTHPDLPIKAIRRLPGNGFQWLYNHDREWLREVLPAIWKRE